ncbi:MAG: methylated-DNA--[protein]-cysteine S-methyltransferase [Deltaproteobacteria bacterium]|nr:methylated-DNA--[protein]-cysteine S-methyltransferase [Deltaproteobacteria bacterium]
MPNTIIYRSRYSSPIGVLFTASGPSGVTGVMVGQDETAFLKRLEERHGTCGVESKERFAALFKGFDSYFSGKGPLEGLLLDPRGTAFELSVWNVLMTIPYGQTISYGEAAEKAGLPKGARAVGLACGKNPIPILIPCHRVIKEDGSIGGYTGGVSIKKALLQIEGVSLP